MVGYIVKPSSGCYSLGLGIPGGDIRKSWRVESRLGLGIRGWDIRKAQRLESWLEPSDMVWISLTLENRR